MSTEPADNSLRSGANKTVADVHREEVPYEQPDGGSHAWSQVIAAHIAAMMSWGFVTSFGIFQLHYKRTMHLSAFGIGSTQILLCFVFGALAGPFVDSGYSWHLYIFGAAVVVLGMFMSSMATEYWHILLTQGVCCGMGGGLMFMPAMTNVAKYFQKKRSLALGWSGCGTSTGAILFAAIVQFTTPRLGFPWSVRLCGFISIFLATVGSCILRPRERRREWTPILDLSAFKNMPYLFFCAGSFLVNFSLFTMLLYINSFAYEILGLGDRESINFLFIQAGSAAAARPLVGWFGDRYIGPVNTFFLNCIVLGVMAFAWIGVREPAGMYAYSAIMGFLNGAAQGIFLSAATSFVGDAGKIGTWLGMSFGICGAGAFAGPPAVGRIIDASGGKYFGAQILAGSMMVAGSIVIFLASRLLVRKLGIGHIA